MFLKNIDLLKMKNKKISKSKNIEYLMDMTSTKESDKFFAFIINKTKFNSEFDDKGSKKFLDEKEMALKEIILDDEIKIDNIEKCKLMNTKNNKNNNYLKIPSNNNQKGKNGEMLKFPTFGENDDDNLFFIY